MSLTKVMSQSLLTGDRVERICESLRLGASRAAAAEGAGVDRWVFYTWLRRGRQDQANGLETSYAKLVKQVAAAESESEILAVAAVRAAGSGGIIRVPVLDELRRPVRDKDGEMLFEAVYEKPDWKALAWILERRFPAEWANKSEVTVAASEAKGLSNDMVGRLKAALARPVEQLENLQTER